MAKTARGIATARGEEDNAAAHRPPLAVKTAAELQARELNGSGAPIGYRKTLGAAGGKPKADWTPVKVATAAQNKSRMTTSAITFG